MTRPVSDAASNSHPVAAFRLHQYPDHVSQIQAPDRTQPGLPMKKGRAGTMTHDYERHGVTTLFARSQCP
jgi:hypothetical protein